MKYLTNHTREEIEQRPFIYFVFSKHVAGEFAEIYDGGECSQTAWRNHNIRKNMGIRTKPLYVDLEKIYDWLELTGFKVKYYKTMYTIDIRAITFRHETELRLFKMYFDIP